MALRDVQCLLEAGEDISWRALEQALALAQCHDAKLSVQLLGTEVTPPKSFIDQSWVSTLVTSENTKQKKRVETTAAKARELVQGYGGADVGVRFGSVSDLAGEIRRRCRCFDLTILEEPGSAMGHRELIFEEVLFGSGRPVVVASSEKAPVERIERILIGWDGSIHAARALSSALGLLPEVKRAEVLAVMGEKSLDEGAPADAIAKHLQRHGIETQLHDVPVGEGGVGATIDAQALKLGVDLIVMGGFGRSRFRELVLGGVTRDLSHKARTHVLFNH